MKWFSYWRQWVLVALVLVAFWILLNLQYGSLPPVRIPL